MHSDNRFLHTWQKMVQKELQNNLGKIKKKMRELTVGSPWPACNDRGNRSITTIMLHHGLGQGELQCVCLLQAIIITI